MKITILWSSLTPYMVALFRCMSEAEGANLQLIYQPPIDHAPIDEFDLSFCGELLDARGCSLDKLCRAIRTFHPDCIFMSSWNFTTYRRACRRLRKDGVFVVASMDNQYLGTMKQRLGILTSPWFLKPAIDTFLVAGDRQAAFARMLGFDDVMYGFYTAETDRFLTEDVLPSRPPAFLFVGRLVEAKGIRDLASGYRAYRESVDNPWDLLIAGTGPLESEIQDVQGITHLGFIQPGELPGIMMKARCLVLPSRFEPWGVVVHEAAASGMAVIASHRCGSVTMFVRDGVNGYIVPPRARELSRAMVKIATMTDSELAGMGDASRTLARLWSPAKLAHYFLESIRERLDMKGRR
ncbi:MAG: glycosyltransferase family 4 protein [Acidobacteriota bacterium]